MFKSIHTFWRNVEPYKTLFEFLGVTGIGSYLGWYSPVVDTFGKPLSIIIAITILLLFYAIIRNVILSKNCIRTKITSNYPPDNILFKLHIGEDGVYKVSDTNNIKNYKLLVTGNKKLLILFEFFCDITNDIYRFDINGYNERDQNPIGSIFYSDIYENKDINIVEFTFIDHTFSDIDYLEIKWAKHESKIS